MKNIFSYPWCLRVMEIKFKKTKLFLLPVLFLTITACVKEFIPVSDNMKRMLVVEGLVTDQLRTNTVKLSKSQPFGVKSEPQPLGGCIVSISDDIGNVYNLAEREAGTYITDSTMFRGVTGRFYTLHIITTGSNGNHIYESYPVEMTPVPPIDSLYYEKIVIEKAYDGFGGIDECQIYLDTHDPENNCRYFRWDFTETWVLRLLFPVENITCWITEKSGTIHIKNTAAFNQSRIVRYPINYISNVTDRLKTNYSILVNQYSLSEDEFNYWEKLQKIIDQSGGLYDIIPSSVAGNMMCIQHPGEKVLGYFSVSAVSSRRIFIKDYFAGIIDRYADCVLKKTYDPGDPPGLGTSIWILDDEPHATPPFKILTDKHGCADCTVRGSNIRPSFWKGDSINPMTNLPYKK